MAERGLFANGLGIELASINLGEGVIFRVGRASDSHQRVAKGELFVEMHRGETFLMSAPLKRGAPLKGTFGVGVSAAEKTVRWGLADVAPQSESSASRVDVSVPEGVVWIEFPTT